MTQKFWVILYWFSTPKTVRKVLARLKYSVVHLHKARSGFSILTEEYLTIQTGSPTDSSSTHIRGQWENLMCRDHVSSGKVLVTRNHAGSDSYRGGGLHRQKSRLQQQARSAQVLRNSPRAMPLPGYELARPEITYKESALLCSTPRGFPFNFR